MVPTLFLSLLPLLPLISASSPSAEPAGLRKRSTPRRLDNSTTPFERDRVARSPPAGWQLYLAGGNDGGGCYHDRPARILPDFQTHVGESSVEAGLRVCQERGYIWAGLQYTNEVFCSNSSPNWVQNAPSGECSSRCRSGESCGGTWRMNIYAYTPPTTSPSNANSANTGTQQWAAQGCHGDSWSRVFTGASMVDGSMTAKKCQDFCAGRGFKIAGVEYNSISAQKIGDSSCSHKCNDGSSCGGAWALSVYQLTTSSPPAVVAVAQPAVQPATQPTTQPAAQPTTQPAPASPQSYIIPTTFPGGGSSGNKQIYAHVIIGNTYPYSRDSWRADIDRAQGAGLDGFFLNVGGDYWQPDRVSDAYAVAQEKGFKMVLSFDMYEFSNCGGWGPAPLFQDYLQKYVNHPAAGRYRGRSILTTFAGESCTFGQGSVNAGWNAVLGQWKGQIYFAPGFNADPMSLGGYDVSAEVNWGSAWPVAGKEIETSRDTWFMRHLGGREYIGTVSPLFAAHIPGKNFIWRGDNFLFGARWDQLLSMRDRTDIVQLVSWNDYGESTYINEITGDWPDAVKQAGYISSDFSHTALLSLQAFYSAAWKTGAYPPIAKDQIWAMARPHQAWAGAGGEAPQNREVTNDNLYVQIHLVSPASVILCSGSCSTQQGQAGINRFSHPLQVGQTASARVERDGQVVAKVDGSVRFTHSPHRYNFNYWILTSG